MYILVKLNPNQGADLGPNFTLTANVGTLVPATATLSELLVGVTVLADNAATQVFITSQGICTNTLTIAISPATTTTTTSSGTTTTTTTTAAPTTTTTAAPTTTTTATPTTTTTTAIPVIYICPGAEPCVTYNSLIDCQNSGCLNCVQGLCP